VISRGKFADAILDVYRNTFSVNGMKVCITREDELRAPRGAQKRIVER
jgi:hypothetical protein